MGSCSEGQVISNLTKLWKLNPKQICYILQNHLRAEELVSISYSQNKVESQTNTNMIFKKKLLTPSGPFLYSMQMGNCPLIHYGRKSEAYCRVGVNQRDF